MPFARLRAGSRTLRFRLTAWVMFVVFGMVLATMLTVRAVVSRTLLYEFDHVLIEDVVEIGLAVRQDYPDQQGQLVMTLENKVEGHAYRGWFVELYTAAGEVIWASSTVPAGIGPLRRSTDRAVQDDGEYRVIEARLRGQAGTELFVRCGASREPLEADIALVDRIMLLTGLITLLLAPVGGYVLAGRATRPIAQIISTAGRLQPAHLDERLPIRGTGDELDQLSQTINGMLDRIALYIDRNRDFVANAAHDLRSPLAAVRSTVDVALARSRSPEEYAAVLGDVMEECTRLAGLVNRLLLLAEGDAGRLSAGGQAARLDRLVREAADMFEGVAEAQGVAVHVGPLRAVVVPGEEHHLRQVVRNLLDNAIKYSRPPGEVELAVGADDVTRRAFLRVRDHGVGIAGEDLPRIFERFYRADRARSRDGRGGHGLGLSICRAVVSALGGEIEVQSSLGYGTTFTVWLPLLGEAAPDPDPQPAP